LSLAETYVELAGFHLWNHDLIHAQPLVDKALKEDPKLGLAHEEEGFLLFSYGKDGVAADEFSQAYALDPTLYLSLFAKTMLSPIVSLNTPADQAAFSAAMMKVADINPQFAPAYVQMARLAVRQGNLPQAFGLSRRAEELEPWRAGYHLLTGQILLRMGKGAEAAGYAQYVAKHWFGPDHDEAVELWNRVPSAQRPPGVVLTDQAPQNTQSIQGTVQSVTCAEIGANGKRTPQTLVLARDGHSLTFLMNGPFAVGFSDTLWWGEDHFSPCRHLDNLRAVVRYRPAADAKYAGDIAKLSVLDDLPATTSAKNASAQSAAQ
jgi:tetratricopeptide (TPR) repeat protein